MNKFKLNHTFYRAEMCSNFNIFVQGKKMFLDGATKILRENSTFLPVNEKMPVMSCPHQNIILFTFLF